MEEPQPVEWEGVNNPKHRHMRVRCNGHKRNGERCQKPAINGATVCRTHGGATRHVRAAAKRKLDDAALLMAKELLKMAQSETVSDAVKLAAIRDALDRAGLKPSTQVDVGIEMKPYEEMVADVTGLTTMTRAESRAARGIPEPFALGRGSAGDADVIDAEIVPDPPRRRPPWAEDASAGADLGNGPDEPRRGYMSYEEALDEIEHDSRAHNMRGTHIREIGM
jgi:hypothetical protein